LTAERDQGGAASWVKVRFRGETVHARCDAEGGLVTGPGGFVEFRYQPGGKSYKSRPASFERVPGATPERQAAGPPKAKASSNGGRSRVAGKGGVVELEGRRGKGVAVQLWTDGACSGNPGPAGVGVWYEYGGETRELSEYLGSATNNIAELTAILRGLEMVSDPATPVDLMTDSEYCIGLLGLGWKAKANQELVAALRKAYGAFSDLQLVKVRGHAGVAGNERADELAREAIASRKTRRS
jgi:ribonuclease HI